VGIEFTGGKYKAMATVENSGDNEMSVTLAYSERGYSAF